MEIWAALSALKCMEKLEIQIGKLFFVMFLLKRKLMYYISSIHITRKGTILCRMIRNSGVVVHTLQGVESP